LSRTSYRGTGLLCIKAEQGVYSTLIVKPSVGVKSGGRRGNKSGAHACFLLLKKPFLSFQARKNKLIRYRFYLCRFLILIPANDGDPVYIWLRYCKGGDYREGLKFTIFHRPFTIEADSIKCKILKLTGSLGFDFAHHKFRHGLTQIYTVDIKTGFPLARE
jgi:hypothetical protein